MKILNAILAFFKAAFSAKYIKVTMALIILIITTSWFTTCSNLRREKQERKIDKTIFENNIKAINDSLTVEFDKKLQQFVTEKISYIAKDFEDLKFVNQKMYNEFKDVKGIVAGIKSDVSVIIPTLTSEINNVIQDNKDSSKFTLPFKFNYNDPGLTQNIAGTTTFNIRENKPQLPIKSILDVNSFDINLRYNVKEEDNKYIVQATSPSPLVKFTQLDGVLILDKSPLIPKRDSRFVLGPNFNFGLNTNIVGAEPRFGWSVGIGLTYNIFAR